MDTQQFPQYIMQYFWGDNLQELNLIKNKKYIIQVLLDQGDQKAIQWLLSTIDKKTIKTLLPTLRLSKKSMNFWNIYFA